MGRYKDVDQSLRFLAVNPAAQILPGSFEHALQLLIDQDVKLDAFEAGFKNDKVGAPAYSPAVLLKIVLLAYSKGIVHSRDIEALCRENVLFNAISGDSQPHFTTIAKFVSSQHAAIAELFAKAGASVYVTDRDETSGRKTAAAVRTQGGQAEFLSLDGIMQAPGGAEEGASAAAAKLGELRYYRRFFDEADAILDEIC